MTATRHIPWKAALPVALLVTLVAPVHGQARQQDGHDHGHGHSHPASAEHDLGSVRFAVSCPEEVQGPFDQALALLHHMMYEESRRAFGRLVEAHPDCAMAHWGYAMSLFQPLWPTRPSPEQLLQGHEAVARALELGPGSDRERALAAAAEGFFREPESADWTTRIDRWSDGVAAAYREHGEDQDVAAFYALSRLARADAGLAEDRMSEHVEAARVLLDVHGQNPSHPGAIHYTIHANDVTGRADHALEVVRSYGEIAPDVPHALHMPTHIFVRLGEWPEVIEWNRRSADAALRYPAGDRVSHHYPHAMDYLLYAHLQRAEDEKAKAVLEETLGHQPLQDSFISAFHMAVMPARHAIERRAWKEVAALEPRTPQDLSWETYSWAEAIAWFAQGLGAAHSGELDQARRAEERVRELRDGAERAGETGLARYIEIDRRILAGRLARAQGQDQEAVELLRSAAELEATTQKHPITPGALLPPYEALGDLLSELGRHEEALSAYRQSLDIWPGRYRSLLGAARAAVATGDREAARAFYGELLGISGEAVEPRPGLVEARRFLAPEETAESPEARE